IGHGNRALACTSSIPSRTAHSNDPPPSGLGKSCSTPTCSGESVIGALVPIGERCCQRIGVRRRRSPRNEKFVHDESARGHLGSIVGTGVRRRRSPRNEKFVHDESAHGHLGSIVGTGVRRRRSPRNEKVV